MSSKNMQNKDRLLHSSFYLYKLNMRHNVDTQKSLQRNQNAVKGGLLFKGKLLPNDIWINFIDKIFIDYQKMTIKLLITLK